MNNTLIVWSILFFSLIGLSFVRPVWAAVLYMQTFFAYAPFWWWGRHSIYHGSRLSLLCGVILLLSVVLGQRSKRLIDWNSYTRAIYWAAIGLVVNATFVHFLLADNLRVSQPDYIELLKFILLFFLLIAAVRTRADIRILMTAVLVGSAYLGYEITINGQGWITRGRLEWVPVPGAKGSNGLASLMATVLPLAGTLLLVGSRTQKILAFVCAPFTLNVLLLCNGRGAFLGALASAVAFLVAAPRELRQKAIRLLALGAVAVFLLLGDARIVDRFLTTFVDKEERDASAAGRLIFWQAGLNMVADYPLGSGGSGFKEAHGQEYYVPLLGVDRGVRAVHNGYINEMCSWGVQGLMLRMAFYLGVMRALWRLAQQKRSEPKQALTACGLIASITGFMVTAMFSDLLENEWGIWMAAMAVAHVHACEISVRVRPEDFLRPGIVGTS